MKNTLRELRERVYEANIALVKHGLVILTWGNASEIERETGIFAIKPSGVPYEELRPEHIVLVDMKGQVVDSKTAPFFGYTPPTWCCTSSSWGSAALYIHTHAMPLRGRKRCVPCPALVPHTPTPFMAQCPAPAPSLTMRLLATTSGTQVSSSWKLFTA
jgi:hypothetical protein